MKVILYKSETGTMIDKVINLWTGLYGYSHCEIVFDKLYTHNEEKYMCCSSSPRDGQVRFEQININSRHWEIIDVPEIDSIIKEKEVFDFMSKMKGAKYDWKGIFLTFIFQWIHKQDNDKWWCSEICGFILNKFVDGDLKYRISPNQLAKKLGAPRQPFKFTIGIRKRY